MNSITNDYGKSVVAIGAPNSKARAEVKWAKLIERLTSLYMQGARIDTAIDEIRAAGVIEEWETNRILENTLFVNDAIFPLVKSLEPRPASGTDKEGAK